MKTAIFDTEIIGNKKPVFLIGVKIVETKQTHFFWLHKRGDLEKFRAMLPKYTWVGFNSENFDRPLIAAALQGYDALGIKVLATNIIQDELRSWQTYREFGLDFVDYDHIDLFDVAPGPMISLKTYAGRLGFKTMMDMPFHHDKDLTPKEQEKAQVYCCNDLGVTEALYLELKTEMDLRRDLSLQYDIDLRSKSDAQIAEAILKKVVGITKGDKVVPSSVRYTKPDFIQTDHPGIKEIVSLVEKHAFKINYANGNPEVSDFLDEPLRINDGYYQMGIGGLHSTHDQQMYLEADDEMELSDFDVVSYYPNIMMKVGLVPRLPGNKGILFMNAYKTIYQKRMEAKKAGNKKVANSLKITLNGTFGKLGNIYCSFYSPDLLLAVTITGQLNLLCLIHELEKIKKVKVKSANTDGVLVHYPKAVRNKVLAVFTKNAKRTGFDYEETPYTKYAAANVNNYLAIKPNGEAKRKGLFALYGVQEMKNPTMEVCSHLAVDYLTTGKMSLTKYKDIKDFVAVRNVKGGGIQFDKYIEVDDWELIGTDYQGKNRWFAQGWRKDGKVPAPVDAGPGSGWDSDWKAPVVRKSRPPPRQVGTGGVPFGRVARWYMTKESLPPLSYIGSGNTVPKTEGGKVCLTLPNKLPPDLDHAWYMQEAKNILRSCGVCPS